MTPESLVAWRKARGWSQQALAEAIRCSRRSVVNWESGANPIPPYVGILLAAVQKKLKPVE